MLFKPWNLLSVVLPLPFKLRLVERAFGATQLVHLFQALRFDHRFHAFAQLLSPCVSKLDVEIPDVLDRGHAWSLKACFVGDGKHDPLVSLRCEILTLHPWCLETTTRAI